MATLSAVFDDSISKVTLTAKNFAAGVTAVQFVRVAQDGVETILRAAASVPWTPNQVIWDDYEAPLDVPVSYKVTQVAPAGSETASSGAPQTLLSHGNSWLRDPSQPANNLKLRYVQGIPSLDRKARAGVFDIIDRANPIVVTAKRQSVSGEFSFSTETQADRDMVLKLINRGEILMLATPPAYGFGNVYVHVGDVTEERIALGDASDWLRRWTLPVTVVDRPLSITTAAPMTRWQDVRATWVTWNDLYLANLTWDQLKALPAGATSPT